MLQRAFDGVSTMAAPDWLVCALTLIEGHHLEWPENLFYREITPHRLRQVRRALGEDVDEAVFPNCG